jgi:hypothetical protein
LESAAASIGAEPWALGLRGGGPDVRRMQRPAPATPHQRAGDTHAGRPSPSGRLSKRTLGIALCALLFLAISVELARFLSVENVERNDAEMLLQAQAKGDVSGMLKLLHGCRERPACAASVRSNAGRLRRPGAVKILSLKSRTAYSLGASSGKTRLAWTVIGRLPVVQCIEVRRTGNVLAGISVSLLSLSAPIPNEADC